VSVDLSPWLDAPSSSTSAWPATASRHFAAGHAQSLELGDALENNLQDISALSGLTNLTDIDLRYTCQLGSLPTRRSP